MLLTAARTRRFAPGFASLLLATCLCAYQNNSAQNNSAKNNSSQNNSSQNNSSQNNSSQNNSSQNNSSWRSATEAELRNLVPARAPVEKEHIETEFRTASAITDGTGRYIAGVVLITAGYAAEGKYSNFFIAQAPIRIGALSLQPGEYVFGWRRKDNDTLAVKFYEARSGKPAGATEARRLSRTGRIESFRISPPGEKAVIQIGRFGMSYRLSE
jgi:hypothetical protein